MLAYAANRPDPAGRRSSPNVMLVIVAVHIAAIAALMSARMEGIGPIKEPPITVYFPHTPPPPPPPTDTRTKPKPSPQTVDRVTHTTTQVRTPPTTLPPPVDTGGTTLLDPGKDGGTIVQPPPLPPPFHAVPVRGEPQLLTPASQLRPPYPEMKLLNDEEADLRLKLTIDADGRVTAVDPVGRADAVFLDAARRYLIAHWRYRPATLDGRAVATTTVITLSFRLDG